MGPLRVDGAALHVIQTPKLEPRIMRYELGDFEWAAIKPNLPNKLQGGDQHHRPDHGGRGRAIWRPGQRHRAGGNRDAAGAAVYFASDEAGWVSGAVLLVSGGSVMTSDPYRYLMRVNQG